ncbi:LysR family transcriptional regulator [Luteitalea sp. TBR-22]|uniref:LysR family transcriptional regulator n=1 Tax=Luteitalea sp. TBR-22 TaxID=2802971 RepID=UPI001EF73F30|nr:LysR family transcriptional regulator [Luteitalea sp. TBR-22]
MLPDLSIRQLEYLVAVDETATWAQAAATVGVSASALSQGLAELERRLGVPLFDRESRRRQLRPAAAPVLAHARQVLGLTGDLARWADRVRRGVAGRVRLGMIDAAAVVHFPDHLQAFRAAHPEIELLLRVAPSATLFKLLAAGHVDLVVGVAPPRPPSHCTMTAVRTETLSVYGPPGRTVGRPASWGPWVLFPAGSHTRALVVAELRRLGAPLEVVAESHQPEVLREMVRLGAGWTVLPAAQAEDGHRPLQGGRALVTRQLVLATRDSAAPDPAVALLATRLQQDRPGRPRRGRPGVRPGV